MIEPYLTNKTKAIVITSPNNPAGYIISKDEMSALGAYLKDKKLWIIGDEIYEYLSFDNEHVSLLNVEPSLKDRYILINGMSKGFLDDRLASWLSCCSDSGCEVSQSFTISIFYLPSKIY